MTGTLADLTADILAYSTYDSDDFVAEIPRFIRAAEERIWYIVQLVTFKKAQTGTLTTGNPYLQLPEGFLAAASLAVIDSTGTYSFLLNKDVEYIREVYPDPTETGTPFVYAQFDADEIDTTIIVGPTPDDDYAVQLNYFYKPASLTDDPATGTWLSNNAYDTLLYGCLSESANYLKRAAGIDSMGDTYEQRFVAGLAALKNLGESRDRKDTYRSGEKRRPEAA